MMRMRRMKAQQHELLRRNGRHPMPPNMNINNRNRIPLNMNRYNSNNPLRVPPNVNVPRWPVASSQKGPPHAFRYI